jgi:hypothetical protein
MRCKPLCNHDCIEQRHRITSRLKRWNFKFLGAGYYSAVFQHPKHENLVIKYGPLDDGWLVFAAWCEAQRSANNPHLPVIHSIKRYEKHGVYCAVMDKLDCTVQSAMCGDTPALTTWEAPRKRFNYGIAEESGGWCDIAQADWDAWLKANGLSQVFENTLARLRDFALKHGLGRDLHGGNAMLRKRPDGKFDVVLTDPFSDATRDMIPKALADISAA